MKKTLGFLVKNLKNGILLTYMTTPTIDDATPSDRLLMDRVLGIVGSVYEKLSMAERFLSVERQGWALECQTLRLIRELDSIQGEPWEDTGLRDLVTKAALVTVTSDYLPMRKAVAEYHASQPVQR